MKIKSGDIIEDGLLDSAIEQSKLLKEQYDLLDISLSTVCKSLKQFKKVSRKEKVLFRITIFGFNLINISKSIETTT